MIQIHGWTDGSCREGKGGWAFTLTYGAQRKTMAGSCPDTTNNRMEFTAILEAVKAIKAPCTLVIHSDSELAVGIIGRGWKARVPELIALRDEIASLCRQKGIVLEMVWVKGHDKDHENQAVDRLAYEKAMDLFDGGNQ